MVTGKAAIAARFNVGAVHAIVRENASASMLLPISAGMMCMLSAREAMSAKSSPDGLAVWRMARFMRIWARTFPIDEGILAHPGLFGFPMHENVQRKFFRMHWKTPEKSTNHIGYLYMHCIREILVSDSLVSLRMPFRGERKNRENRDAR